MRRLLPLIIGYIDNRPTQRLPLATRAASKCTGQKSPARPNFLSRLSLFRSVLLYKSFSLIGRSSASRIQAAPSCTFLMLLRSLLLLFAYSSIQRTPHIGTLVIVATGKSCTLVALIVISPVCAIGLENPFTRYRSSGCPSFRGSRIVTRLFSEIWNICGHWIDTDSCKIVLRFR